MQTNDPKADLRRLRWDLFRLPSNYLGTGLYNTRVVSLMQALHFPTAVKRLHLHLFPGSWLSSEFSSLSYQVAGTGLAITYSIVLFPPPHFWPSAMWISLKKTQQTITFSLSLSCPPFRCYTKGLPFNSQETKSQNCKAAFQFEGINASKTREWKEKKKVKISFFPVLLKHESEQCMLLWMRKKTVTFRPALFRFGILSICSSNLRSLPWLGEISKTSEKDWADCGRQQSRRYAGFYRFCRILGSVAYSSRYEQNFGKNLRQFEPLSVLFFSKAL